MVLERLDTIDYALLLLSLIFIIGGLLLGSKKKKKKDDYPKKSKLAAFSKKFSGLRGKLSFRRKREE